MPLAIDGIAKENLEPTFSTSSWTCHLFETNTESGQVEQRTYRAAIFDEKGRAYRVPGMRIVLNDYGTPVMYVGGYSTHPFVSKMIDVDNEDWSFRRRLEALMRRE